MIRRIILVTLILMIGGCVPDSWRRAHAVVNEPTIARNDYTGNDSTTVFPYTYKIVDKSNLEVYVGGVLKTVDTNYSVDGIGNSSGGNVTMLVAPANTIKVTILRKQPDAQLSVYQVNEPFPAKRIEQDLDKQVMIGQMQDETLKRSFHIPKYRSPITVNTEIDLTGNANKCPRVNSGETGIDFTACPATSGGPSFGGSGTNNRAAVWSDTATLTYKDEFRYNRTTKEMSLLFETPSNDCVNPVCSTSWGTRGLLIDQSDYTTNGGAGMMIKVRQSAAGGGVLPYKTGLVVDAYNPPDLGGDVSGIYSVQGGGGNAASFFKASQLLAPSGKTKYPNNGWALEVGTDDAMAALMVSTGFGGSGLGANAMVIYSHNSKSKGVLVAPHDGVTFDSRAAYEVGNLVPNGDNQGIFFRVRMDGMTGIGTAPDGNHMFTVLDPSTTSSAQVWIHGGASNQGANILMTGDGVTTPKKTLRVHSGHFQILNNAYGAAILDLDDVGGLGITQLTVNTNKFILQSNGVMYGVLGTTPSGAVQFVCIDATNQIFRKATACN